MWDRLKQSDLVETLQRHNRVFHQLLERRDYDAALAEAQKFEAAVKAGIGTRNTIYGSTLVLMARVYQKQGKSDLARSSWTRAESLFSEAKDVARVKRKLEPSK